MNLDPLNAGISIKGAKQMSRFNAMAYLYVGVKVNLHPLNLPWSHTTCSGLTGFRRRQY